MTEAATNGSSKPARTGNTAFVTHFMPGLIVGLLVGGLAGAFLPTMLEGPTVPVDAAKPGLSPNTPRNERAPEPIAPSEQEPAATDPTKQPTSPETKPETKPAEPAPSQPK